MTALLEAVGLCAGYGGHAFVRDVDLTVEAGQVVALLGPNGAGKTTTLLALAGDLQPISGHIEFDGVRTRGPLDRNARRGLAFIGENRSVFHRLTVAENLRLGKADPARAFELFPELRPLMGRKVGLLSGGEQQMLTIGRALSRTTSIVLIDELSLGLAPLVVGRLLQAVRQAANSGIGVVMVEQHVEQALQVADRVHVMNGGEFRLSGSGTEIRERRADLQAVYLTGRADNAQADAVVAR